jgi:ribonuclease VapC
MFLDASAIVAIVAREADAVTLGERVDATEHAFTSALAVYEAVLGLARARGMAVAAANEAVALYLSRANVEIIPITAEIGRAAIAAFERYGRGRHPARLNMGDCFAYACAKTLGMPLLYKGDDFAQTDIPAG